MLSDHTLANMPTDYTLIVYKIDLRRKDGATVKHYDYKAKSKEWMEAEVADLSRRLYPAPKYKLEFIKTYREVKIGRAHV